MQLRLPLYVGWHPSTENVTRPDPQLLKMWVLRWSHPERTVFEQSNFRFFLVRGGEFRCNPNNRRRGGVFPYARFHENGGLVRIFHFKYSLIRSRNDRHPVSTAGVGDHARSNCSMHGRLPDRAT